MTVQVSITTLSILQNHYPERLGMALCYLPPRLFSMSWKVLSSLIIFPENTAVMRQEFCSRNLQGDISSTIEARGVVVGAGVTPIH